VQSAIGGAGGGHTTLTPEGEDLVTAYRRYQARLERAMAEVFEEELGGLTGPDQSEPRP